MRTVALVTDYGWPTGGTEEFVRALAESLADQYQVRVLRWADSQAPLPDGVAHVPVANGDVLAVWEGLSGADAAIVVTSFNVRLLARVATEALGRLSVPTMTVVQTAAHSSPGHLASPTQRRWLGDLVGLSAAVVGVSEAAASAVDDLAERRPATRPAVRLLIENGARLGEVFRRRPPARRRVLFIGRPVPSKGYEDFLHAAESVKGLAFEANTVSVDPPARSDAVKFTSRLDDGELRELFASVDLVVAPYGHAEGLPLAVLEALNCGLPVLGYEGPALGPLLRRYGQASIPARGHDLAQALRAWRDGTMPIAPPEPGTVPSLAAQVAHYTAALDDLLAAPTARRVRPHPMGRGRAAAQWKQRCLW